MPLHSSKNEIWDLFYLDGRFAGTMVRGDRVIPPNMYHRTVEIIPSDKNGTILVTRRALEKKRHGGCYEFPAGSVISREEPYEAAKRELFEETGLRPQKLIKLAERNVPGMKRIIYLAYIPDLLTATITLQPGETMGYKLVSYDQWLQLIADDLFDNSRRQMYSQQFYEIVKKMVGTKPAPKAPEFPPLRVVGKEDTFHGTFQGVSGSLPTVPFVEDNDIDIPPEVYL